MTSAPIFSSDKSEPCIMTPFVETCLNLSHFLVCFNSSANFVIYLLAGEKFRKVWLETFCSSCVKNSADSGSNPATMHTMSTAGRAKAFIRQQNLTSTSSQVELQNSVTHLVLEF